MNDDLPPGNRAIVGYRAMLWLMPVSIAFTTGRGLLWMYDATGWKGNLPILLWAGGNFATTFGLGFFEARLRQPPPPHPVDSAANFTFIQLLVAIATFCIGFAFTAGLGGF